MRMRGLLRKHHFFPAYSHSLNVEIRRDVRRKAAKHEPDRETRDDPGLECLVCQPTQAKRVLQDLSTNLLGRLRPEWQSNRAERRGAEQMEQVMCRQEFGHRCDIHVYGTAVGW